jgi:hypothetical protein
MFCAMMTEPEASFVVPLHNKEDYIMATLASLAAQTNISWEAVVVNNNSTDSGPALVADLSDPRITLISSSPSGVSATRNAGLRKARGKWVCFLDADDLVEPDYLDSQLKCAAHYKEVDVVVCNYREFEHDALCPTRRVISFPAENPLPSIRASSIVYCPGPQHMFLAKRAFLEEGILWSSELDKLLGEDCAFWFEALHRGRVAFNNEASALYRIGVQGGRFASFCGPEKLFQGLDKAIACNERLLASLNLAPTDAQCEHVLDFYSRVGLQLAFEGKHTSANQAFAKADAWLERVPTLMSARITLRKLLGSRLFSRLQAFLSWLRART